MSSNAKEPHRQLPSTYFVRDRANLDEMTRLAIQNEMVTQSMGGVLPEQPDETVAGFRRILDVGCGTGGWLIEVAKAYPSIKRLVGIDANGHLIDHAREQARQAQVSDRVDFQQMDALLVLEFPRGYFDLVNGRFMSSFMRTWNWPKMLKEMQRVTYPGGVVRLTEVERIESNSPALNILIDLTVDAFYNSGHIFTEGSRGIANDVARLLDQYGLQNIQTRTSQMEFRAGTVAGQSYAEDMRLGYQTAVPFLHKWGHIPDNYEVLYQQMLNETQRPDFVASWKMITTWGMTTI